MKKYTIFTNSKKVRKQIKKIAKQYDVSIPNFYWSEFTISVVNQYRFNQSLSLRQVQALVNCSDGITSYDNKDLLPNHYPNSYKTGRNYDDGEEGYWDDLGSMGYLN